MPGELVPQVQAAPLVAAAGQITLGQQAWIEGHKKSKGIAVLLALLATGAANMYAGEAGVGLIVLLLDLFIFLPLIFLFGIGLLLHACFAIICLIAALHQIDKYNASLYLSVPRM